MNKLPLAQRLEPENPYTAVAQLGLTQLRDFFLSLDDLDADGHYSDIYYGIVCEALEKLSAVWDDDTMFDDRPTLPESARAMDNVPVAEAVVMIMNLPKAERAQLLYHIMIEPFI